MTQKVSFFMISKVTSDYEFSEPYLSRVHPDVGCTASLLFQKSVDQSAPGKKVFIIQRTVCRSWGVLLCRIASSCLLFQLMIPTFMLLIFSRQCWTCFVVQASFQISPNATTSSNRFYLGSMLSLTLGLCFSWLVCPLQFCGITSWPFRCSSMFSLEFVSMQPSDPGVYAPHDPAIALISWTLTLRCHVTNDKYWTERIHFFPFK